MAKSLLQRRRWGLAAPVTVTTTAVVAASSPAVPVSATGGQGLKLLVLTPSTNCYIVFGDAAVGAATSAHLPLIADNEYKFASDNNTTHYRVIHATADGVLNAYVVGGA